MPGPRLGRSSAAPFWHRRPSAKVTDAATLADVMACYRLLLGRPPDPEGLAHYRGRLASGTAVSQLVAEFLGSVEFARAYPDWCRSGPGATQLVATGEGFKLYVDPTDYAVGHTIARTGVYEPDVTEVVKATLQRGGTFLDIGANIGWFSLLGAALVGPSGRVVAIEPNPVNVAILTNSLMENGLANVDVLAVAASDRTGIVALETDGSNGRVIPLDHPPPEPVKASWVVAAQPVDFLVGSVDIAQVDLVKLDVEGAEPLVLRGAALTLARCRPVIVTEFFPRALESAPWGSPAGYLAELRGLGYHLSVIGIPGGQPSDEEIMKLANQPGCDQVNLLAVPA